jgi:hypothetical protein
MHPVRQQQHRRRHKRFVATFVAAAAASLFAIAQPASAVILSRTSSRNTGTPSGTNANSGWQWQGHWGGGFIGTPIAPKYFITAEHIGGKSVGQNIYWNGKNYPTNAVYDDPSTDLRIYRISGTFSSYAPIYTGTSETGKRAMVFGRGTKRGLDVKKGTTLKGWKWGTQDKTKSWGENLVAGTVNAGGAIGQVLKFTFNKQGTSGAQYHEGALSTGDSAGGVFINDGGKWKLAGVNYLVDGPFSLTGANGSGFNASLFDKGGLYQGGDGRWAFNPDTSADVPGNWYATRISSRQSWIKSIIGSTTTSGASALTATAVPEPASLSLLAIGAAALLRRGRRRRH